MKKFIKLAAPLMLLAVLAQSQSATPTPSAFPPPGRLGTPMRIRISAGVAEGLVRKKVNPEYPQEAKDKKIKGDVEIRIIIDREGNVARLDVTSGDPILAKSAVKAVRQWKYAPYLLNGEPVEVETLVRIKFWM